MFNTVECRFPLKRNTVELVYATKNKGFSETITVAIKYKKYCFENTILQHRLFFYTNKVPSVRIPTLGSYLIDETVN